MAVTTTLGIIGYVQHYDGYSPTEQYRDKHILRWTDGDQYICKSPTWISGIDPTNDEYWEKFVSVSGVVADAEEAAGRANEATTGAQTAAAAAEQAAQRVDDAMEELPNAALKVAAPAFTNVRYLAPAQPATLHTVTPGSNIQVTADAALTLAHNGAQVPMAAGQTITLTATGGDTLSTSAGQPLVKYSQQSDSVRHTAQPKATDTGPIAQVSGVWPDTGMEVTVRNYVTQPGTPTPAAPIAVDGARDTIGMTVCGRNIFGAQKTPDRTVGTALSPIENGVRATSTLVSPFTGAYYVLGPLDAFIGKKLTFSCQIAVAGTSSGRMSLGSFNDQNNFVTEISLNASGSLSWTVPESVRGLGYTLGVRLLSQSNTGTAAGNYVDYTFAQVEIAEEVTAYEPYTGYSASVPLPSPLYGLPGREDEVDLSRGVITRRTGRLALTGSEEIAPSTWATSSGYSYLAPVSDSMTNGADTYGSDIKSSHFVQVQGTGSGGRYPGVAFLYTNSKGQRNLYFVAAQATVAEVKDWLAGQHAAGTPVTVYYELAQPVYEHIQPINLPAPSEVATVIPNTREAEVQAVLPGDAGAWAVNYAGTAYPVDPATRTADIPAAAIDAQTLRAAAPPVVNSRYLTPARPATLDTVTPGSTIQVTADAALTLTHNGAQLPMAAGQTITLTATGGDTLSTSAGQPLIKYSQQSDAVMYTAQPKATDSGSIAQVTGVWPDAGMEVTARNHLTQAGTPTPDAPLSIEGAVSEIETRVCGLNHFKPVTTWNRNGQATYVIGGDGIITVTPMATGLSGIFLSVETMGEMYSYLNGHGVVMSFEAKADAAKGIQSRLGSNGYIAHTLTTSWQRFSYVVPNVIVDAAAFAFYNSTSAPTDTPFEIRNIQIELGFAATPYQPYTGYSASIPLPAPIYGLPAAIDEVDLNRGVFTRRTKSIIITGSETVSSSTIAVSSGYVYAVGVPDSMTNGVGQFGSAIMSSHFTQPNGNGTADRSIGNAFLYSNSNGIRNVYFVAAQATVAEFKAWLAAQYAAGTPVTIYYQLATPVTEQIPPIHLPAPSEITTAYVNTRETEVRAPMSGDGVRALIDDLQAQITALTGA